MIKCKTIITAAIFSLFFPSTLTQKCIILPCIVFCLTGGGEGAGGLLMVGHENVFRKPILSRFSSPPNKWEYDNFGKIFFVVGKCKNLHTTDINSINWVWRAYSLSLFHARIQRMSTLPSSNDRIVKLAYSLGSLPCEQVFFYVQ